VSWIHIDDWLAIVRAVLEPGGLALEGVVHATGPHPMRNTDLMAALRRGVRRPAAPPTPEPLVRLGAILVGTDPALAMTGRRTVPARLLDGGLGFGHRDLDDALADLSALPQPAPVAQPRVSAEPHSAASSCRRPAAGTRASMAATP
jgi:NAD dependent epimerase/dehydratase family enzyme